MTTTYGEDYTTSLDDEQGNTVTMLKELREKIDESIDTLEDEAVDEDDRISDLRDIFAPADDVTSMETYGHYEVDDGYDGIGHEELGRLHAAGFEVFDINFESESITVVDVRVQERQATKPLFAELADDSASEADFGTKSANVE